MARTDANPPNVETSPGVPTSTPKRVGDINIDLLSKDVYMAVGTVDASDWEQVNAVVASVAWGSITGTIGNQTDLVTELGLKLDVSAAATVATSGDYNDLINKPDLSALNDVAVYANLASFPVTGTTDFVYIAEDTGYMYRWNGSSYTQLTDQTAIWGQIGGTLSNQTDLQAALDAKAAASHTHTASEVTDFDTEVGNHPDVVANTSARHTHSNFALLETYTQTEVNLADAVTKRHDHSNKATLDAITAAYTTAEQTKVGFISVTQAVDLDAIETRVNELDAAVVLQGTWDASAGTFPGGGTAQAGASYIVSVGGTVDGVAFAANDRIVAILDNASTTTYASNWHKLDYTDQVLSVNSQTGAVVLDADDIDDSATTNKFVLAADITKLGHISVSQAVNLDTMESDIATNNAKVSNATHTGDVAGATALTIQPTAISGKTLVTAASGDMILVWDATDSTLKRVNASDFLSGGGGTTLDGAYDFGGAGAGRTITAGDGAVEITVPSAGNNSALIINQNDTTNDPIPFRIIDAGGNYTASFEHDNATGNGASIRLFADDSTPSDLDLIGTVYINGRNSAAGEIGYGDIEVFALDVTAATEDSCMRFGVRNAGNFRYYLEVGAESLSPINGISIGQNGTAILSSRGNFDLQLQTGNATTGTITIVDGANGNITLAPNGTGQVLYGSDEVAVVAGQTSVASDTTPNPVGSKERNEYYLTALAGNATIAAPSGTPANGNSLIIRIRDNGTSRTLTWNAAYVAVGVTLPTATTANKLIYVGCKYNSSQAQWDVIAVAEEA